MAHIKLLLTFKKDGSADVSTVSSEGDQLGQNQYIGHLGQMSSEQTITFREYYRQITAKDVRDCYIWLFVNDGLQSQAFVRIELGLRYIMCYKEQKLEKPTTNLLAQLNNKNRLDQSQRVNAFLDSTKSTFN